MESGNNHASHENIWHQQQQIADGEQNKQFFNYQPMQQMHHGFDLQREIVTQPSITTTTTTTPENVHFLHFLRDNNGPYVKIYYTDNNKEYELFERNQMQQQQQENPTFMNNVDMFNNCTQFQSPLLSPSSSQLINQQHPQQKLTNDSSSVIHHLVTSNLGPGKFGTFGGQNNNNPTFSPSINVPAAPLNIAIPVLLEQKQQQQHITSYNNNNMMENGASTATNMSPLQSPQQMTSKIMINNSNIGQNSHVSPSTTIPAYNNNSSKKQRIIAEVKPYKLSYSDVVSKNGTTAQTPVSNPSSGHSNSNSSSPNTTMPVTNNHKITKAKYQSTATAASNNGSFEKKYQENGNDKNRKSPTNPIANNTIHSEVKKAQPTAVKFEKPSTPTTTQNICNQPQTTKKKKHQSKDSANIKSLSSSSSPSTNRNNEVLKNKYTTDSDEQSTPIDSENDELEDNENEETREYYDIHRNVYQGEHHKVEKIKSYKKCKQINTTSATATNSRKNERNQKRMSSKSMNRRQKHKFLEKLISSCIEYLYIFVKWLWMLIYDVSYLSTGILWDRLNLCYQYVMQGFSYLRQELNGNPGKALIAWLRNVWKKFDNKFDKKSKWAFWRWMFKKQASSENIQDYHKDGKLPKTAEEAMKSLLNCKEKDAYSILGVSPDCPQEQIKKHYKKIAVLVHPDKNKQAGAEEAFKVLQRSFELIGEAESRKQYDENLAKALHTEKAFNELNDLLIQLQTKISEAANTIRCSSCCFRHPRKPTGRKPFAARECSTCKIRHAAREGDIWAETTFFGLRWKYLALMEGNVYDITEWALCQRGALSHLQANSCVVQYKIVLGGNQQNQNQAAASDRDRFKKDTPVQEPQEDFFLNNIYAGQGPHQQHQNTRRRFKKN